VSRLWHSRKNEAHFVIISISLVTNCGFWLEGSALRRSTAADRVAVADRVAIVH
jgi:hypothetical protein